MVALGCVVFVVAAAWLEVLGGANANSPVPGWADLVPITWPQPMRVLWWTGVAATAAMFRYALHRLGLRPNPVVTAVTVAPFVIFAAGIAVGASWSTWH